MTKSEYLSNSAKLLLICSALLFAANALGVVSSFNDTLLNISGKIVNISFYAVLILGFLAFNGEGIAYKHTRETKRKKKTFYLKLLLLSAFLIRFIKTPVKNFVESIDVESVGGILSRFFLSALNTVASYGFLLMIVAVWYIFRDSKKKKLLLFEGLAFLSGFLYNTFKLFNYFVSEYEIHIFGEFFVNFFSETMVQNILCLVTFAINIVMFAIVMNHYGKEAIGEQEAKNAVIKKMMTARKIYSTDCYGLDTFEDDFFLERTVETE